LVLVLMVLSYSLTGAPSWAFLTVSVFESKSTTALTLTSARNPILSNPCMARSSRCFSSSAMYSSFELAMLANSLVGGTCSVFPSVVASVMLPGLRWAPPKLLIVPKMSFTSRLDSGRVTLRVTAAFEGFCSAENRSSSASRIHTKDWLMKSNSFN